MTNQQKPQISFKIIANLCQFKKIFQYIYSNVYPEVYCSTERRGFHLKSTFQLVFKTYKDKKEIEQTGKNPQNYQAKRHDSFAFEQKPVEIDMFNNDEEKQVKQRVVKRKKKRQEVVEKKDPKRQKKPPKKQKIKKKQKEK